MCRKGERERERERKRERERERDTNPACNDTCLRSRKLAG